MTFMRRHLKTISIAAACVALGAGISAVASAGAASTPTTTSTSATAPVHRAHRTLLQRMVHGNLVVATYHGFANVTIDRGAVQSVSSQQLTLKEGTKLTTYKSVTLTIPTTARVRDNGQPATLSAVKPGQRAIVIQAPKQTFVIARTPVGH